MRFTIFIILILTSMDIFSAVDPALDLKQVIKVALQNNPTLQAAQEKLNQYEAQRNLSISSLYPTLTWNLGVAYLKDASYSGTPKFGGVAYDQYSSDLKLVQPLYSKGLYSAINVADYDKKIQVSAIEIEERSLTQNIIEAFYRLILNQQNFENLLKNQDIIQKSLITSK